MPHQLYYRTGQWAFSTSQPLIRIPKVPVQVAKKLPKHLKAFYRLIWVLLICKTCPKLWWYICKYSLNKWNYWHLPPCLYSCMKLFSLHDMNLNDKIQYWNQGVWTLTPSPMSHWMMDPKAHRYQQIFPQLPLVEDPPALGMCHWRGR